MQISFTTDGHGYRRPSSKDRHRRRRHKATSSGSESSPRRAHEKVSRHQSKGHGRSPPRSHSISPHDRYGKHHSDDTRQRGSSSFSQLEETRVTSPTFERRQRRHKQAAPKLTLPRGRRMGKNHSTSHLTEKEYPTAQASRHGCQKSTN